MLDPVVFVAEEHQQRAAQQHHQAHHHGQHAVSLVHHVTGLGGRVLILLKLNNLEGIKCL